jgi:hypothetical protein
VNDLPNDTPDVTVLLCEIQVPELGWVLVEIGVGSEDSTRLSLGSDDSLDVLVWVLYALLLYVLTPIFAVLV